MYNKGASSERELAKILFERGFAVIRAAGSGRGLPGPDLLAVKNGRIFCIECKAHQKKPKIDLEQLKEWKGHGATILLAWKVPYKGWAFFDEGGKEYSLL